MTALEVVRVFTDEFGRHGNPLAIVAAGDEHDDTSAQTIAAASGCSETVFIDDADRGALRIYVPRARVPFAGHPLVGSAWYLGSRGRRVTQLVPDAGPVPAGASTSSAWIRTTAGRGVPWASVELADPSAVDDADSAGADRHDYMWAWIDEPRGLLRARAFASLSGTVEDEATGSAAIQPSDELGRSIEVVQGQGSRLAVRCDDGEFVLSGRVVAD